MSAYSESQERYGRLKIDTEAVLERLRRVSISVHCWQGDDVGGFENSGDATARLALLESLNTLPFGAVWDEFCRRCDVPAEDAWLAEVKTYEQNVLAKRG